MAANKSSSSSQTPPALAVEEPLEIRVRGVSFAVLMRTPGRDKDLATGFLAAEGLLHNREDLLALESCLDPHTGIAAENILNAALAEGIAFTPRLGTVSSACGVCGTRTLEELQKDCPPLAAAPPAQISTRALHVATDALRAAQPLFNKTAGCHGAALWDYTSDCALIDTAEDVGRHNAVDKLLGAQLLADAYPLAKPMGLVLSGRISFELVQKAWLAAIPLVVGIGMPTSLAVETANAAGITLIGWLRDANATVFAGPTALEA
jgi:FdhD protein